MVLYKFKIPLAGDGAAGKTSLIIKFIEKKFSHEYKSTIGVDIFTKNIKQDNDEVLITLWDIAGQERFKIIRKGFFEGARGAILVYDVTRRETFDNITNWYEEVKELTGDIPIVICGNKIDLKEKKVITTEEGKKLCSKIGAKFIETSAKTGDNVDQAFMDLSKTILNKSKK